MNNAELRLQAEERLGGGWRVESCGTQVPLSPETVGLVHELQVHQLELELQNEELERARAETEEALARYTDLYEFAPVGYLTLARDGAIRQVNLNGARLLGQPRSRLAGRPFGLLLEAAWRPVFQAFLAAVFRAEGEKSCCELEVRSGAAPALVLEFTGQAQEDGESCRVVAVDVTERKRLEAAQTERLASIGLLAAGVAHEVNNPLAYVLFNLESLVRDLPRLGRAVAGVNEVVGQEALVALGPEAQLLKPSALEELGDWARQALGGTQRIVEIMRGLGAFARVESAERGWVDVEATIDSAIKLASNQVQFRARLVRDFAAVPPVWASAGMLGQVFLNLLMNAVYSIPEGNAENHRIAIRTWSGPDSVYAEFADSGLGLGPDEIKRIFEPCVSTKAPGTGSGLGLTLCRNIVQEFGGELSVQSRVGEGARFLVRLPLAKGAPAPAPAPTTVESPARAETGVAATAPEARARVLMVDDEPALRSMMIRLLGQRYEVHTAASAREAQALLGRDPDFDVILCDVMMPGMSGPKLHEWFAAMRPDRARQFVFITGGTFAPDAASYLAQVENPKLEKPFNTAGLLRLVAEVAAKGRLPARR